MAKKKAASKTHSPKARAKKKIRDLTARELDHVRGGALTNAVSGGTVLADAKRIALADAKRSW